jgi:8-oxo-dGTP diphosphatase
MSKVNEIAHAQLQTLLYLIKDNEILLIRKKRGLGEGFYNGVGGKVHIDETPEECAKRECEEEIGVRPLELEWVGLLEFVNNLEDRIYVHVYICRKWEGEPKETDEAKPIWFKLDDIPYSEMWEDDIYWLPLVLKGEKVFASFEFKDWKLKGGRVYTLGEVDES